jgi:hypothetical protein
VARAFPWLDVTSPYDAASSGAIPILREGSDRIASLPTHHIDGTSAGFRRFLQPLEFHFRYLRSADPERGFDYLTLLLGPKRIARREPTPATPPRAAASA